MIRILPFIAISGFLLELVSIIAVGRQLGVLATVMLIIGGFVAGGTVVRLAGVSMAAALRRPAPGSLATQEAAAGFLFLLAGLLLILPGFLSDAVALLLLIGPLRSWLAEKLARHFDGQIRVHTSMWPPERRPNGPIIEGDAVEIEGEIKGRK